MRRLATYTIVISCMLGTGGAAFSENNKDMPGSILNGVLQNASNIKNISFDYSIEHHISERWKTKKLESMRKQLEERGMSKQFLEEKGLAEQLIRAPYNENTQRAGNFIRDADAFKITNKMSASADNKVFTDETTISDGVKITTIDKKGNSAVIYHSDEYTNAGLSFFPDKFQNLFLDGKSLQDVAESNSVTIAYIGRQSYEGTECEVLEIIDSFTTPEGTEDYTKDRVWIVPQNGFLIKCGISFKDDPNKPINSITTELKEVSNGIWYYSKILFESFPSKDTKPDVTMCLTINETKINQILPKGTFVPDLTAIPNITDQTQ